MNYGPLDLLVIQGTPFCNINCKYCYLPDRLNKSRISLEVIEMLCSRLFSTDIVSRDFTVTWHAGEPMVLPIKFYEQALAIFKIKNNTTFSIKHNFQTNATLINDDWCLFFKEHNIDICVSIDGPSYIHNANRIDRKGRGTYDSVLRGIETLKKHNIPFSVISVVTNATVNNTKDFYDFFKKLDTRMLGINLEEVEGENLNSSLFNLNSGAFQDFIKELLDLYYTDKSSFAIREFWQLENFILNSNQLLDGFGQQTVPYKIISVDTNGNFSTFSPEILNLKSDIYGDFLIGNVFENGFIETLYSEKFNKIYSDILRGIILCKNSCKYFDVCGGGTPSNKYSENGTFISTETNYCKNKFQIMFDSVLDKLEEITAK